jgi:hypothetical protein
VGGWCGPRYQAFRREELEELGIKWGRIEEAFEEGQGPHRAVEPVIMVTVCPTCFINKEFCISPTECIYEFPMIL